EIAFIEHSEEQGELSEIWNFKESDIRELNNGEFFIPGMVDTHIHAPQYAYAGTGLDLPLLQWLNKYTFPAESRYKELDYAKDIYTKVVKRTLKNGTTTACYFATIHTDSSLLLADITDKFGQRAFVGKVCMDINNAMPQYKECTLESVEEMNRFLAELLEKKYPRVKPIVTPRFVPSCTKDLLMKLGLLVKKNDTHVQSHISENRGEVELVKNLFPDCKSYSEVYDKYHLLTNKQTVMAHGCYLSDKELKLFKHRGAAISHCPNSNISIFSGLLDVRNVLNHKVKLGLGTDVAGGYSASMLDAVRKALDISKILTIQTPSYETLTFKEVFRLATLGGSQALGLDNIIGNFEVGKEFDAVLIKPNVPASPFDVFAEDSCENIAKDIIQKFIYLGDDRNMTEVYVAGSCVVPF
uniref:Guanine deaminase n=1 Tax=Latimeria chalumnae TaxID=7897 RepID=H3ATH0_LATCH